MGIDSSEDSKLYRVRVPKWPFALIIFVVVLYTGKAAMMLHFARLFARLFALYPTDEFRSYLIDCKVTAIVDVAAAVLFAYFGVRQFLEKRHASLRIDAEDFDFIDWRGRTKTVEWSTVTAVRVWRCGSSKASPPAVIRYDRGSVWVPQWLESRNEAIEEVVQRAGLVMCHKSWWVTIYESGRERGNIC